MFITELSIKRPTVSWVMSLILIVFGLFVFWKLPVRELPNGIQPPVVQIQVDYKSAAASIVCLLYTSPSPRDRQKSRMPSSA